MVYLTPSLNEYSAILSHFPNHSEVRGSSFPRIAQIGDDSYLCAIGMKSSYLKDNIEIIKANIPVDQYIFVGLCGAINPELRVGDVVNIGTSELGFQKVTLYSANEIISSPREKEKLFIQTNADVVNLEGKEVLDLHQLIGMIMVVSDDAQTPVFEGLDRVEVEKIPESISKMTAVFKEAMDQALKRLAELVRELEGVERK